MSSKINSNNSSLIDDSSIESIFNSQLNLPQTVRSNRKPKPINVYDIHDYLNPYGEYKSGANIINQLNPSASKSYAFAEEDKRKSFNRKVPVSRGFSKPKKEKLDYTNTLVGLVGSKANKDIVRNDALLSSAGASIWIDKNHKDEGWYVEKQDEDNDGIPEVMVYRPDGTIYSMNGYHLKRSDMGTRQPYYEQFPTREERQQAREDGITMNRFAAMKYGPKPIDVKNPYEIEYEKNPYDDPAYLRQLLSHRAPRIPATRSAYQVFTMFITKSLWEGYKEWLAGNNGDSAVVFTVNKGTKSAPKYEFKDYKSDKPYLAAEDMLSYGAYLYEKYIKNPALELFDSEDLIRKAASLLQLRLAKAKIAYEANPTETNTKRYNKINIIMNNEELLAAEIVKIVSESEGVKEACENRVSQVIKDDNRRVFLNQLFKELIQAQTNNNKLIIEAEKKNVEVDMSRINKLESEAQKQKKLISHKKVRIQTKPNIKTEDNEEDESDE